MKFPIIATAAAILTGIHAEECSVCPGGINVDPGTETENGNTCGNIQSDAARFDADDGICDRIKGFEELCCGGDMGTTTEIPVMEGPESDTTCSACPNGITVDADTETEGNNVCGTIQADAARFEADDNICGRIKSFEDTCCPDVATTVAAISTTETGSTTAAAVATSSSAAAVVVNSTAAAVANSTVFAASTEAILTTTGSGSSCVVCPGGITAPLTLATVAGKTCADLLPDAAGHENGDALCEIIKQSEDICCPAVITTSTSTEAAAIAAANTTTTTSTEATSVSAGEATSSTIVASVSSTTAAFDFDLNMTSSPTKAPAPVVTTMPPIENENPPSSMISGFSEVYDPSGGYSVSVKPSSMFASIFIVSVMVAKLS